MERQRQQRIRPRTLHLGRLEVVDVELKQHEIRRRGQHLRKLLEMVRRAGLPEIEDLVLRTEEAADQIREALPRLDPLAPRERVAYHRDAVPVGALRRELAIAESE